jgi:hypothetical protein
MKAKLERCEDCCLLLQKIFLGHSRVPCATAEMLDDGGEERRARVRLHALIEFVRQEQAHAENGGTVILSHVTRAALRWAEV